MTSAFFIPAIGFWIYCRSSHRELVDKGETAFLCEEIITKNEWGGKPVQVYKAKE
jgi:hypothetical protein